MIYLSKGILSHNPSKIEITVSHCGSLHKLTGIQASIWLAGRDKPGYTNNPEQEAVLNHLAVLGIVERSHDTEQAVLFRILTNCVICPVQAKLSLPLLNQRERRLMRWLRFAGLHLTMAELTLLSDRGIRPMSALLGEQNRQTLTEEIYTTETIYDGILETLMEKSPARDGMVRTVLALLRKNKIYLV